MVVGRRPPRCGAPPGRCLPPAGLVRSRCSAPSPRPARRLLGCCCRGLSLSSPRLRPLPAVSFQPPPRSPCSDARGRSSPPPRFPAPSRSPCGSSLGWHFPPHTPPHPLYPGGAAPLGRRRREPGRAEPGARGGRMGGRAGAMCAGPLLGGKGASRRVGVRCGGGFFVRKALRVERGLPETRVLSSGVRSGRSEMPGIWFPGGREVS